MTTKISNTQEFLRDLRDQYAVGKRVDSRDRADAEDCVRFHAGGELQWSQDAINLRRPDGHPARPVITWNLLSEPVAQVVNDSRAMKPAIKATPLDNGDADTAEYYQKRIRAVEYESDADIAYDTAAEQQIISGRGFYRVVTEYRDHRSFDQVIRILPIPNQFSVVGDAAATKYDRSDSNWYFIHGQLSKGAFIAKYGKEAYDAYTQFDEDDPNFAADWKTTNREIVPEVEYWKRTWTKDNLFQVICPAWKEPVTLLESEMKKNGLAFDDGSILLIRQGDRVPVKVLNKRVTQVPSVEQFIVNGVDVLAQNDWAGTCIPIVPVWGKILCVGGEIRTKGLLHDARDPQRNVNYTVSRIAEVTSQVANSKFIVPDGAIIDESEWQPTSTKLFRRVRMYDPNTMMQLPMPVPDNAEPPIQALTVSLSQQIDAVKKTTSIYSASVGDRSNETSGRAISERKVESDSANFHFQDNQARSRKFLGRILLELIDLMDTGKEKQVTVHDESGASETVMVNQKFKNKNGKDVIYKPGQGKYEVGVTSGPSYLTQKQATTAALINMAQNDPNLLTVGGDVVYDGIPGCEQIAERYREAVIPQQFRKPQEGAQQLPPEAMQAVEAAKTEISALNEYAKGLESQLKEATDKLQIEIQKINAQKEIAALRHDVDVYRINTDLQKAAQAQASTDFFNQMKMLQSQLQEVQSRIAEVAAPEKAPVGEMPQKQPAPQAPPSAPQGGIQPQPLNQDERAGIEPPQQEMGIPPIPEGSPLQQEGM